MRKILSFLVLALFMTVTAGANGTKVGDLYYLFDGTNATVTYPGDAQPTSGNNAYTGAIDIPATVTHDGTTYNVTAIGDFAFQYSTVTSLTMHEGLLTIGRWSISNISTITEITIPNSVTALGAGVSDPLSGNSNLKTIVLGTGLTSIGQGFLYSSSKNVTDIYFNAQTAPNIGAYFCNGVNKSTINIHVKETAVNSYMKKFNSYGIAMRVVGDIADDTPFVPLNYTYDTSAKTATVVAPASGVYNRSITIPETVEYNGETYTVTTIGSGAFGNSLITSLTIPETVTRIDGTNFNNVCLKELRIPNSVTYISGSGDNGSGAIIPTIYIGSGIKTISGSFMYNATVSDVYMYAENPPSTGTYSFSFNPTIHVYKGCLDAYKAIGQWATVWGNARNLVADLYKDSYTYDEFLAKKTQLENITSASDPGFFSTESYAPVAPALASVSSISNTSTTAEITAAMKTLLDVESNLVVNNIEEGYYFIVSAGNGCGYYTGSTPPATNYNYEDKNALYNDGGIVKWKAFDRTDRTQLYMFTANGSNWNVFNLADETYINNTTGSGSGVYTSETAENAQKFALVANGSGKYTIISTNYCYSLNGSHNGSSAASGELKNWGTTAEAIKFGMNVWYIHKATEAEVEDMFALRNLVNTINSEGTLNTITPKNHHDNTGTRSFLLGNERTSIDGLATSTEHLAELQAAYDAATAALAEGKEKDDVPEVYAALVAAKAKVDAKSNPLVDGYYHLIAEYGDDTGDVPGGFALQYGYDAANSDNLYKRPYVETEPKQMFKAEYDEANGKIYLQNVESGKYLGVLNGTTWTFTDTKTALNIMSGKDHNWYWGSPKNDAARSCSFILYNADANGIRSSVNQNNVVTSIANASTTTSEAWTISWAFRPADDYYAEYITNKEYIDFKNAVLAALATPTAKQDGDLRSDSWINGYERTAVAGWETTQDKLDALQEAWDTYDADRSETNKAVVQAAMEVVNSKWVPLTDGYYYMITRFNDDQLNNNNQALTFDGNVAWKKPVNNDWSNPNFIFEVKVKSTKTVDGHADTPDIITIKNLGNGKYLGAINGSAWEYTDTETEWSYTTFAGSDFFSDTKHAHVFGLNIDGKFMTYALNTAGSAITTTTGGYAWYRAWMFRPADVEVIELTIGATGYSTYVSDKNLIIPEGVTANGVTGLDGSDVELTQLSGNVLAADEPVILQGEAGKKFYFIATDEIGNTIAGNQLEGTGTEGKSIGANEAYVLYNNQGTAVFRIAGAMTLPAHKA
ncbi:MAG: leucine-rich repeat protein, partial [Bacteroidaceae bacterium]|nr:leucine-rich repeat protein [Bacteroidaceae bacterium]